METTAAIDSTTKITPDVSIPTTSTSDKKETESTNATTPTVTSTTSESPSGKFETFLKAQLASKSAGSVSEEELFSALVGERIESLKDSETAGKYTTALSDNKRLMAKSDGFVPFEDAAKKSLAGLRDSGALSKEEADKVYSEAFAGAQLDANTNALYDDRGGPGDPTMATAEFAKAMSASKAVMDQIAAGTLTVTARSLDEASNTKSGALSASSTALSGGLIPVGEAGSSYSPTGTKFDGDGGFLWKPVSVNQSKLAVLLPNAYKGLVSGVTVLDAAGVVLDSGTSTGYGDDGEREKFSFNKTGGDYGDNLTVNVAFMDGTSVQYTIPDGSKRYD